MILKLLIVFVGIRTIFCDSNLNSEEKFEESKIDENKMRNKRFFFNEFDYIIDVLLDSNEDCDETSTTPRMTSTTITQATDPIQDRTRSKDCSSYPSDFSKVACARRKCDHHSDQLSCINHEIYKICESNYDIESCIKSLREKICIDLSGTERMICEMIYIRIDTRKVDDKSHINIDQCREESTDELKGKCVKMKCEAASEANLDCVFKHVYLLCSNSLMPFECVNSKISTICNGEGRECYVKYNIRIITTEMTGGGKDQEAIREKIIKPKLQLYDSTLGHLYAECKMEVSDILIDNNLINCLLEKLKYYDHQPEGRACIEALRNKIVGKELEKEIHSCFPDTKSF